MRCCDGAPFVGPTPTCDRNIWWRLNNLVQAHDIYSLWPYFYAGQWSRCDTIKPHNVFYNLVHNCPD